MPTLLAPVFLFGLLALGVPILVHLIHRERRQAVAFPSLMFLRKVPFRSVRRQKLRHLLLFALRCLAFALLAFGFARPFFAERSAVAAAGFGARTRVILLDRSYSMGYADRFERARAAALAALRELGPEDEAGLVLFAERAEAAVAPTREHERVLAALQAAAVGSGGTRFAPALKLAGDWLLASERPQRDAILVSDCQKRGLDGLEQVRFPPGAGLHVVSLALRESSNAAVAGVAFDRELAAGRERIAATARLVHTGSAAETRRLGLEIGGRVVQQQQVELPAAGAASVSFEAVAYPAGLTRGRVLLDPDRLGADDVFNFVLARGQELPLLLIEDGSAGPYLRRALEIGDRPRFRVESKADLQPGDLAGRAAVIFVGTAPAPAAGAALADFVRSGGGVIASLAGASWRGPALELLPVEPGAIVDRTSDRGATLAWLELDHPALELFKAPRSGDFSTARFLRYRAFALREGGRALARLDDGSVALAERELGRGRVLALAAGFDALTNDLALQPVFLPLLHQLARHAAGHRETRPARSVGEVLALVGPTDPAERGPAVTTPAGERVRLDAGRMAVELMDAGFYEIQRAGRPAEAVAVNVDTAESDLTAADPQELQSAVTGRAGPVAAPAAAAGSPADAERRQSLWWYLLAAAFLLLLAETVLANRVSARAAAA